MTKKKTTRPKAGRPTAYKAEFAEQAGRLCAIKAFTNEELAQFFGVKARCIYTWQQEHEEFRHAIKSGKNAPNAQVEASLHMRAIGFIGPDDKYYPPDVVAGLAWLHNRDPDRWRRNPDPEKGATDAPIPQRVEVIVKDARRHAKP